MQRPRTHCGAVHRHQSEAEESQSGGEEPECSAAGAVARELAGDCRLCMRLRLKLGHEERTRVKAQEQLAAMHAENVRLRSQVRTGGSTSSPSTAFPMREVEEAAAVPAVASTPGRCRPDSARSRGTPESAMSEGFASGGSPLELDVAGRALEGYRREVDLLRESLRERDRREASFTDLQRKQREEHESAKQEWQAQLAGLVCEVQDLEMRNDELQASLLVTESTTTASARGGTPGIISGASSELPSRSPSCCDDTPGLV